MPKSRLSVLHVVLSLDGGGLERVVIDLAKEIGTFQQTASILCVDNPGTLAAHASAVGAKLYCAEKGPGLHWSTVDRIRSILRELRPDVIHTHQISALLYLVPIERELMPVLVHTEHSNQFWRCKTFRDRLRYFSMLTIAGRRADRVFGVSQDATQSIARSRVIAKNKVFTVPNGIDLSKFQMRSRDASFRRSIGIPDDSLVLGSVGRLDEVKRPDILLAAFAAINSQFPNTHLLLVGDGPLMSDLRRQAADLKISDRVHFTGFQDNPAPYLHLLDIFVLTSRMEGMPLSVIEAAASGIPVIASNVGGLSEMSNGNQSILLYDFQDMDALHAGLRRLITDFNFRHQLGESGRKFAVSAYSSKRMALDYDRHYYQLLKAKDSLEACA
jgi:glycosyltransferase involved in cell wall biosynthesis